jgi:hypothetical protein
LSAEAGRFGGPFQKETCVMLTCPSHVVEKIRTVVDYLWEAERQDFDVLPDENHIFTSLVVIARWLTTLETNHTN